MERILSKKEWALGFFEYPSDEIKSDIFLQFYKRIVTLLTEIEASPTHIAAEGNGYSGKLTKCGGKVERRLIDSAFEGITVLGMVTSAHDSSQPSYDRYVSASLSLNAPNELLLCLAINDSILPFGEERFRRAILDILQWRNWSFGFGLDDLVVRQPEFHVLSLDNGKLTGGERKSLMVWYSAKPEERLQKLRGVYPVAILNQEQLQQRVSANQSLNDFVKSNPAFRVEKVGGLTIWEIPESQLEVTREQLRNCPALIT